MKDSHLIIAILVFVGLIAYIVNAVSKINKLEQQKSIALNQANNLNLQKADLEVKNQHLENLLDQHRIRR